MAYALSSNHGYEDTRFNAKLLVHGMLFLRVESLRSCVRQVDWVAQLHDWNTINMITFWYVHVLGEDCPPGPNVLGPVPRARSRPCVTSIAGIRTHFFFLAIDSTTMWMRKLSCHCEECRHGEFKKCGNDAECGAW